jgi:hypothetical protein
MVNHGVFDTPEVRSGGVMKTGFLNTSLSLDGRSESGIGKYRISSL